MYHLKAFFVGFLLIAFVMLLGTGFAFVVSAHPHFVMFALSVAVCYSLGLCVMEVKKQVQNK